MKRTRASTWISLTLILSLTAIHVPTWLTFKGNTIGFVCAIDTPPLSSPAGTSVKPDAEQKALDPVHRSSVQASFIAAPLVDGNQNSDGTSSLDSEPIQPEPSRKDSPIIGPHNPSLARMYYVRLSAPPGTDEARTQHSTVTAALTSLPGRVTIRHEFGKDEDDVINVISFKLEGDNEGLEQVAALDGVVAIYPVRTRKRPEVLPLGPLRHTRPSLESAHNITGVTMVHEKLGLTGKGIKVGIIDTGVDYKHPALGGCFGPGCTVAYGYDFVGDDYDHSNVDKDTPKPDNDPMDCSGHGTHVAGIVAARNVGPDAEGPLNFVGVAPGVTLGAYRVFGCEGEVGDDVLLAAFKAAYRDGMDIVNLSLGGSSGWPDEPLAMACAAYIAKGLHIASANGNNGDEGLFQNDAPATAAGAVAVGSVDNTHYLGKSAYLTWQDVGQGEILPREEAVGTIGMAMAVNATDEPVISFKSDLDYVITIPPEDPRGCTEIDPDILEKESQVPSSNIIVLLRRGGCAFADKAASVAKADLGGMLVYDIIPEQRPLAMSIMEWNISAAGLSFEDATSIINALESKGSGRNLVARFSSTDQVLESASGGMISDFSSWGPGARLDYKPDIVAPGGMIYSTYPRAKGGFATLQGTSMATPYIAGVQALYLSKHGKTNPLKLLRILQSTAVPTIKPGSGRGLTSVYQQGAGLVSMQTLFSDDPPTVLSPTALFLNDTQFQKLDHGVTFHNPPSSKSVRTWTMIHRPALSVNGFKDDGNYYAPVNQSSIRTSEFGAEKVVMSPSQLKLAPGKSGIVHIHFDPPRNLNIQERWLYSGYLEFHCQTDGGVPCGSSFVSYAGMHGYLASIPILNPVLAYPALQLDRCADTEGAEPQTVDNHGPETNHDNEKESCPGQNGLLRDQSGRVIVGKNEDDWIQILVSVNFPTALLTIEVESVCDDDHSRGCSGDKIRLEVGGSGRSRFQIDTEEDLEEAEHVVAEAERLQGDHEILQENVDIDPERIALMRERLSRSQEQAFMPSGLYMPYEGYSRVMLQSSTVEEVIRLHRKKGKSLQQHGNGGSKSTTRKRKHVGRTRKGRKSGRKHRKKPPTSRHGGRHHHNRHHHHHHKKSKSENKRHCVPRILGLIPNGYNPWLTRSSSYEGMDFHSFPWMGDLLLQNHDAAESEKNGNGSIEVAGTLDSREGQDHGHKKKKHAPKGRDQQAELTKDLPDGRYRLVIKALKPWGIRGKAKDVERWSSPVIMIKRKK